MEHTNAPREIVLTRRFEPEEVVLDLRCPLPERMLPVEENALFDAGGREIDRARRRRVRWGLALLATLIGIGMGLFFWQQVSGPDPGPPAQSDNEPYLPEIDGYEIVTDEPEETTIDTYRPYGGSAARLELQDAPAEELSPGEIYAAVAPATVTVISNSGGAYGVGTGVIFSTDGYVLTNYHIIAGASECRVWVTDAYGVDAEYNAMLVGGGADEDLAVLKIDGTDLPFASFGRSDELAVGDKVYAIGNPLGLELRGTFTDGIVSAVDRDVDMEGVTMTLIQTNAALNHGNSGGPLVNSRGQVVGINTIKMISDYDTIEGLGFAIPTSIAVHWVNDIITTGEIAPQALLGVSLRRVPETLPDGTTGLRVEVVEPGLGAEKAGLQVGDFMVTFNGQPVVNVDNVLRLRRGLKVGDRVPACIWRDGEYLDVLIELMAG